MYATCVYVCVRVGECVRCCVIQRLPAHYSQANTASLDVMYGNESILPVIKKQHSFVFSIAVARMVV